VLVSLALLVRQYYYMHASLALWNMSYGHTAEAQAKYWWRIEPDVQWSSPWPALFNLTVSMDVDLLLPRYTSQAMDEVAASSKNYSLRDWYPHWEPHQELLRRIHPAGRLWSLVSLGRYSRDFVRMMTRQFWSQGILGYEEILLPFACKTASIMQPTGLLRRCRFAAFFPGAGVQSVQTANGSRLAGSWFRYRPYISCSAFLEQRQRREGGCVLAHPVKERECIADAIRSSRRRAV